MHLQIEQFTYYHETFDAILGVMQGQGKNCSVRNVSNVFWDKFLVEALVESVNCILFF